MECPGNARKVLLSEGCSAVSRGWWGRRVQFHREWRPLLTVAPKQCEEEEEEEVNSAGCLESVK